jgi:hypothetical protein
LPLPLAEADALPPPVAEADALFPLDVPLLLAEAEPVPLLLDDDELELTLTDPPLPEWASTVIGTNGTAKIAINVKIPRIVRLLLSPRPTNLELLCRDANLATT